MTKLNFKKHIVDATAGATSVTPFMAATEVISGLSNQVSLNARLVGAGLGYLGLSSLYSRGRDYSKKIFKITKETSERAKWIHDTGYSFVFSNVVGIPIYALSGERDLTKLLTSTVVTSTVFALGGGAVGFTIDAYRDFLDIQKTERLPAFLGERSPNEKKAIAAVTTGASIGLTAGVYALNNFLRS